MIDWFDWLTGLCVADGPARDADVGSLTAARKQRTPVW